MAPGDDVVMSTEFAVRGSGLQQPALEAGAVHSRDGAAAVARPDQALGALATETDAAYVIRTKATGEAGYFFSNL